MKNMKKLFRYIIKLKNRIFKKKSIFINPNTTLLNDINEILTHILTRHNNLKWTSFAPDEKYWETFGMNLLNEVYPRNLIRIEEDDPNSKAIDLYDQNNSIGIQVSIETMPKKVHTTILMFEKHKLYEDIKCLKFFLITNQKLFTQTNFKTNWLYSFDKKKDIITFNSLLISIGKHDNLKLENVKKILLYYYSDIDDKEKKRLKNLAQELAQENDVLKKRYREIITNVEKYSPQHYEKIIWSAANNYDSEGWVDPTSS